MVYAYHILKWASNAFCIRQAAFCHSKLFGRYLVLVFEALNKMGGVLKAALIPNFIDVKVRTKQ